MNVTTNQSVYLFWSLSYNDYASTNDSFLRQSYGPPRSYLINPDSKYEE